MKQTTKLLIAIFLFALTMQSCEESDNFSTDSSLKIGFPSEAVSFDTVFTTMASPIQKIKIYNNNDKSISIESIELMHPDKSGFRINVNGQTGTVFHNEDLLREDSLYIIADIIAPEINGGRSLIKDSIRFTWNGNTKYVRLEAHGIDVEVWDDKTIGTDTHLSSDKGYYIKGKVTVSENATLTLKEGTNLYFDRNGSLMVNGTIKSTGTLENPVAFRGHRLDFVEKDIPYDNVSDQWEGITIGENSFGNVFNNVRIRNSRHGINFLSSNIGKKKASLTNTIIHNTSIDGITAEKCDIDMINCQISNSKGHLLNLLGGTYQFLHCTFANYYEWHPRTTTSVILTDSKDGLQPIQAEFINSIIVGTFKDELSRYHNKEIGSTRFSNSLIQTSKTEEGAEFVDVIWNIESVFLFNLLNSEGHFFYSFELLEDSPARDKASVSQAQQAPKDLRGISRLTDGKPDIGCYEWTN